MRILWGNRKWPVDDDVVHNSRLLRWRDECPINGIMF